MTPGRERWIQDTTLPDKLSLDVEGTFHFVLPIPKSPPGDDF